MNDLDRLRKEYKSREQRLTGQNLYSKDNPAYRNTIEQRRLALERILLQQGIRDLSEMKILEIGCGSGGVLKEFLNMGVKPNALHGIDLLFNRLLEARSFLPAAAILNADGQDLPFPTASFDFVIQYTAFSSVLDPEIKKNMAADMLRVLKPGGYVIWYDFWWNPKNKQTKGIKQPEIKRLFPSCNYQSTKITLAPPISRLLAPFSEKLVLVLESFYFLNTHFLVLIEKQ